MGKKAIRKLNCKICKSTFPSYWTNSIEKFSRRTHRNTNKACLREQCRLRSEHIAAGNNDDLNFALFDTEDDGNVCEFDDRADDDVDNIEGDDSGNYHEIDPDVVIDEANSDQEIHDNDENDIEGEDDHSMVDTEDSAI